MNKLHPALLSLWLLGYATGQANAQESRNDKEIREFRQQIAAMQVQLHSIADANFGRWNYQLQAMRYEFDPIERSGVDGNFVQTGAFGFPFLMAAKGDDYSVNGARSFDASRVRSMVAPATTTSHSSTRRPSTAPIRSRT